MQGRKSVERPTILRTTEDVFCLFGSGSSGSGIKMRSAVAAPGAGSRAPSPARPARAWQCRAGSGRVQSWRVNSRPLGRFLFGIRCPDTPLLATGFFISRAVGKASRPLRTWPTTVVPETLCRKRLTARARKTGCHLPAGLSGARASRCASHPPWRRRCRSRRQRQHL